MELKILSRDISNLEQYNAIIDVEEALRTIVDVYVTNLIENPSDEKYRKIRTLNIHFEERIGNLEGGMRVLQSLGFSQIKHTLHYSQQKIDLKWLQEARMFLNERLAAIQTRITELPSRISPSHRYESILGAGWFESQGPRSNMEDDHIAYDNFSGESKQGFFAVYDGHGGRQSVDFVAKALHINLQKSMETSPAKEMSIHLTNAYLKTDSQLRRRSILQSGSTAVTCVIRYDKIKGKRMLHVANAGDSRAILSRKGRKASRLTIDHKPSLPEEMKRICSLPGGFVSKSPPPRVLGYLAVSRALGDHSFKERDYVVATPYCQDVELGSISHAVFSYD
mmetsp:Transcript_32747/g.53214  ORF Transcript_32747/g.53214 Transcript_32747/m.53214 type:complete len:337 (+) Transcript_32747:61-1071(+)